MKIKIVIFTLILITAFYNCKLKNENQVKENTKPINMDWITGKWEKTIDKEGYKTFENWSKVSETEYKGHGFVKQNNNIIWEEHLRLIKENDTWLFEVSGVNEDATVFKIQEQSNNSFISLNPENEFPETIEYQLVNEQLKAVISGGGPEVVFHFKKLTK